MRRRQARDLIASILGGWLLFAVLGATAGCGLVFPARVPMHSRARYAIDEQHPARCAVIFMPGFADDDRGFIDHGFVDALRARSLSVDTVSAAATFGYYLDRSIVRRLREDIMLPIRARGYKEIWIVGISMGGLGTVLLARDQPDVAGIVLFAPYLGSDDVLGEIDAAGGLPLWDPDKFPRDDDRAVWRYLKAITRTPNGPPEVFLGAGADDPHRTVSPHPLALAIPFDHRFEVPGGHDWAPWEALWTQFLDRSDFRRHCGPEGAAATR